MMSFIGIIPARFASTRFPGKPLADIMGKPMIQRVYEKASEALEHVVVATDDNKIYDAVKLFGGKVVMTSPDHQSGTDRCFEALNSISKDLSRSFDVVVNIQGDEPFIKPEQIELIKTCFEDSNTDIATLIKVIEDNTVVFDANKPKVVIKKNNDALFFSRSAIPFIRGSEESIWSSQHNFYQHIGMYAYKATVLSEITELEQSGLEKAESLEQLRWLENGYTIKTAVTKYDTFGIDTPQDLEKALALKLI